MSVGAAVGLIASFWETLDKLSLLKNTHSTLSCNISSIFNCSNILNAHQSSVFGFPNSLLCVVFFSLILSAGLVGWLGSAVAVKLRFVYESLAVFFVCFGYWFFWQSIFNLRSLCILCIFCYIGLLGINAAWFRLNYKELPVSKNVHKILDNLVSRGIDIYFWCLIGLTIALEAVIKLR